MLSLPERIFFILPSYNEWPPLLPLFPSFWFQLNLPFFIDTPPLSMTFYPQRAYTFIMSCKGILKAIYITMNNVHNHLVERKFDMTCVFFLISKTSLLSNVNHPDCTFPQSQWTLDWGAHLYLANLSGGHGVNDAIKLWLWMTFCFYMLKTPKKFQ